MYFNVPTQVVFRVDNFDGTSETFGGIGYHDVIICGCCGTTFTDDPDDGVIEYAPLKWISISDEIKDLDENNLNWHKVNERT